MSLVWRRQDYNTIDVEVQQEGCTKYINIAHYNCGVKNYRIWSTPTSYAYA